MIGLLVQAAGGLFNAYGALEEGKAQQRYYNYLADQADQSAAMALKFGEIQSGVAQDQGLEQTKILKDKTAQTFGTQDAASAANGTAGSVTQEDVAKDSFDRAKMDELAIRYNADSASWSATTNAKIKNFELRQEAANYRAAGKNSRYAGKMNAISSVLGSAGQVASGWMKYKDAQPSKMPDYTPDGKTVMPLPSRRK